MGHVYFFRKYEWVQDYSIIFIDFDVYVFKCIK